MREVGNFPLGCWVTLARPDCFWPAWQPYFSRFILPGPSKTLIIVRHAPLYLIPFSVVLWFTVPVIFSYHSFIITPPILFSFRMYQDCIALCDYTFSPISFKLPLGVYQRYTRLICATTLGISLEFYTYWHNVAWMMDTSKNIYHTSSGSMEIITCHLSPGWVFHYICHCMFMTCLWWRLHVVHCEHVVFEIPWVIQNVYIRKQPLPTCIRTVYTRFSPSLSKYGVYNFSPLIVLCTRTQLCAVHFYLH